MNGEYLSSGFVDVDAREDKSSYTHCLSLLDSLPYFRQYKHRSYDLLALRSGHSLLEIGCGIGDDMFRIADRLAPGGLVVGLDNSIRMIEKAVIRNISRADVAFTHADARNFPFKANSFARCRADRTLQHIREPERVIAEMVRVLQPNGMMLVYDNDWGTFSIGGSDDETTRIIETMWADSFTNRWIGRYLKRYFLEAGLQNTVVEPSVSVVTDFELADRIYNIRQTVQRSVKTGRIPQHAAQEWLSVLQNQSRLGVFFCSLTAFSAVGTKPS